MTFETSKAVITEQANVASQGNVSSQSESNVANMGPGGAASSSHVAGQYADQHLTQLSFSCGQQRWQRHNTNIHLNGSTATLDNRLSRRSLLKGGMAAVASLWAGTSIGGFAAPCAAAEILPWTINANGWPLELAFFKRLLGGIRPDLGPLSPTGGFVLNVRDAGSSKWQPTLGFERFEKGISCVFRRFRPVIPPEAGHLFRVIPATHSG